jgi:hypothetical protein
LTGRRGRDVDVFSSGLKAWNDADGLEEFCAPTCPEATVTENLFGKPAEGGLEPAQGRGEEGRIRHIMIESLDDASGPFDNGHQDFRAKFRWQRELAPDDGSNVILVKRDDPVGNGDEAGANLSLLVEDDLDFMFGLLERLEKNPQKRIFSALRPERAGGFPSQVRQLFEVPPDELKHFLVNSLAGFLRGLAELGEGHKDFPGCAAVGAVENLETLVFGFFKKLQDIETATLQEPNIRWIKNISGNAGGVENQGGSLFPGGTSGRLSQSGLNERHSFGSNLGPEEGEAGGGIHEVFKLGRV